MDTGNAKENGWKSTFVIAGIKSEPVMVTSVYQVLF